MIGFLKSPEKFYFLYRVWPQCFLQVSDQRHTVLLFEQPGQIVLIDEKVTGHGFQRQLLAVMLVQEGLDEGNIHLLRRIRTVALMPGWFHEERRVDIYLSLILRYNRQIDAAFLHFPELIAGNVATFCVEMYIYT